MTHETSTSFQIPELFYKSLFDALAGNNVLLKNDAPVFTILAASDCYAQQTGTAKELMIGKGIFEVFPSNTDPEDTGASNLDASLNYVLQYKEQHQLPEQRYDRIGEDGRFIERYWQAINKPVFSPEGQVAYIIHSAEDITKKLKTENREDQLEGIEKAYHLFMQLPAIIGVVKGPDHVLELANEGAINLWGKGKNIIGKPLLQALPELEGQGVIELFDQVLSTGKPYMASKLPVSSFRTGAKEELYFDVVYQPYYDEGSDEPTGVFTISHDVTELVNATRKVEESDLKYRSLFESMNQGYCTLEIIFENGKCVNYRYLETNPGFDRHLGMSNALGKTIREIAPDIEAKWFDFYGGVALTGIPIRIEEESKAFNKWFEVYAIRIGNAEDHKVGVFFTDITERKKAEELLRESETRFRNLIEHAPVSIAITNGDDMIFESINPSMLRMIKKNHREEVIGKKVMEVLPELENQQVLQILKDVLHTGKTFIATEMPVALLDEGVLQNGYFNLSYTRIIDNTGTASIMHVSIDVTNQVLARRKIEESEAKLRSILNSTPTAIGVFTGPDLIIENPNQFLIEVLHAGPDIEGKSFRKVLEGLVNEEQKFIEIIDTVRTTGALFEGSEIEVYFKAENRTRYFNISFIPLKDENKNVYAVLDVSVDVTQQVEARQKLEEKESDLVAALEQVRLSKEAAALGTFDMDMENGTMHWGHRCRTLFGISHSEPVSFELDFLSGLHPDDHQRVISVINNTFDKSVSNGEYDVEYRTIGAEDGIVRWVRAKGKVYFNDQDKPLRFIGSVLDITDKVTAIQKIERLVEERTIELAAANESLLQANEELKRSNANLEEFAYAASHDLKEPIRKIHIFADRLKSHLQHKLDEEAIRYFERLQTGASRMSTLIDDLLMYSHINRGASHLEFVDLNVIMSLVEEDLELAIRDKEASITIDPLPGITGHKRQLQQLFENLVGNALKYSKPGVPPRIQISSMQVKGTHVSLHVKSEEREKSFHLIEVKDNGIGFNQSDAERIFNVFTRLHGNAVYKGTGVGLSIARKVVENHNGYIMAESTGDGAIFKIYLPVA